VLADAGVTQASAVMALRRANPRVSPARVYREAFAVGRDHLTATIHTLVLAYVGASLPLMLILSSANVSASDALNVQHVVEPIVGTLVGSIALLASVPLTTGILESRRCRRSATSATTLPSSGRLSASASRQRRRATSSRTGRRTSRTR
jgi:uncharacterized membrane protein